VPSPNRGSDARRRLRAAIRRLVPFFIGARIPEFLKVVGAKLSRNCLLYETLPTIKYVLKAEIVQNIVSFAGQTRAQLIIRHQRMQCSRQRCGPTAGSIG
jgi:hypothetical protein